MQEGYYIEDCRLMIEDCNLIEFWQILNLQSTIKHCLPFYFKYVKFIITLGYMKV